MSGTATKPDWTTPAALAIPKDGYFTLEKGRYGPIYPRTPACHGFTIIAKVKPGREETVRAYGATIQKAIEGLPDALAVLNLHYLCWVLFEIGGATYFMYQGIFDTDFDGPTSHRDTPCDSAGPPTRTSHPASALRVASFFRFARDRWPDAGPTRTLCTREHESGFPVSEFPAYSAFAEAAAPATEAGRTVIQTRPGD